MTAPIGLAPFVPGGADFQASRELFRALGFEELWAGEGYVGFQHGAAKFILQDYNEPGFAENLMIKLEVEDLDDWWAQTEPKESGRSLRGLPYQLLPATFPGDGRCTSSTWPASAGMSALHDREPFLLLMLVKIWLRFACGANSSP